MSQPAAAPPGGTSTNGGRPEQTPAQAAQAAQAAQNAETGQEQWRYKGWGPQGPGQYQGPYAAYAARMAAEQAAGGQQRAWTPPPGQPGPASGPGAAFPPRQPTDPPRRAYRRTEGRVVAGVAGGIADHLGVSDTMVRLVLIATTVFGGFGVLIYAALWFLMPLAPDNVPAAPGLAAHTRSGMRSDEPPPPVAEAKQRKREKSRGQLPALVAIGIGLCLLLQVAGFGIAGKLFWPLVFAATGLALIWRQADENQKDKWTQDIRVPILGLVLGKGGWKSLIRIAVGLILIGTAVTLFLVQN